MATMNLGSVTPSYGVFNPYATNMGDIYARPKPATTTTAVTDRLPGESYNDAVARRRAAAGVTSAGAGAEEDRSNLSLNSRGGYVGPTAADAERARQQEFDLNKQMFDYKRDSISALLGQFGSQGGAPISRVSRSNPAQEQAARDAAFARAKETAGMNARASMQTLADVAAQSGTMGSTMEARQQGAIIGGAGSQINDFLRDQAIFESKRAGDIADMDFQAAVSQRNADVGRQQQQQQAILSLLGGLY